MEKYFEKNTDIQLIHFTDTLDKVKSILLSSHLKLKYCEEEFCIPNKKISQRAHPMACFSEQNVKTLPEKKITYGKYGIAFSPAWIIKNNIQPVMYIEQNSDVANALATLLIHRKGLVKGDRLRLPIMTIACFVKNTIGPNSYNGDLNFLFKDENEWRYVPKKEQRGGNYLSIDRSKYLADKNSFNNKLSNCTLKFDIDVDIDCLYCVHEREVAQLIEISNLPHVKVKISQWQEPI